MVCIAVLDDDAVLANLVRTLLAEEGYRILTCSSWREAHAFVARHQPDLLLLDVELGAPDYGWRVLNHLTLDPETRRIPVILWVPGRVRGREQMLPPLQPGVFTMTKPFDLDALLGMVRHVLDAGPAPI